MAENSWFQVITSLSPYVYSKWYMDWIWLYRAARKTRAHDRREYRDYGRVPWFLTIAVILRNGRDYRWTAYNS